MSQIKYTLTMRVIDGGKIKDVLCTKKKERECDEAQLDILNSGGKILSASIIRVRERSLSE